MRSRAALTLTQLLLAIALIWGVAVLVGPHMPRILNALLEQQSGAQRYFNEVLIGIEKSRDVNGRVPYKQPCEAFTLGRIDRTSVQSCSYDPSVSRDFYMLAVVSRSAEVFRYAGRGPE